MNDADFYIGKPIRSLQTMLRVIAAADEAIPQVVPDGIYGPDTEAAVTAFQVRSGLPPTGEADQATWNRVVDAYLKLGSFVLPIEALRIRWQPQQSIDAGEENLHLFPIHLFSSSFFLFFKARSPLSAVFPEFSGRRPHILPKDPAEVKGVFVPHDPCNLPNI